MCKWICALEIQSTWCCPGFESNHSPALSVYEIMADCWSQRWLHMHTMELQLKRHMYGLTNEMITCCMCQCMVQAQKCANCLAEFQFDWQTPSSLYAESKYRKPKCTWWWCIHINEYKCRWVADAVLPLRELCFMHPPAHSPWCDY